MQVRAVADDIRRGIDDSILEGHLANILQSGGYLSSRNVQYFTTLLDAQRNQKWLTAAVICSTFLLVVAIIAGDRIRRERNRIRVTKEGLRQSEQRFRGLLEQVRLIAVITDLHGTINFWNEYAEAITGWSKAELIGRPFKEILNLRSLPNEADELTIWPPPKGTQPICEGWIMQKDGGQRWVEWSCTSIKDSAGRLVGYASLAEDVTELRTLRAEAARLESEEQFCKMADIAPLMIWIAGPEMRCTFVNKAWLEFTGHTLEQELGDGWTDNVHPDDIDHSRNMFVAAWEARRGIQFEYRKRQVNGDYRWMLVSGSPRLTPDNRCLGYIGTCTDITDLKRSRDEDIARQKLETVGRLAGGIAHDFNNLLGGVLAQAELGLTNVRAGALSEEELNNIRNVAIRGAGIVRQLMIYAGQESAASEAVGVSSLVDDMRELLKVVVSKHIVLRTELASDLPPVLANLAELRQIVLNLVTNASEAIGEVDGLIVIRTAKVEPGSDLWAPKNCKSLVLEVSDSGCGISPDIQSNLFEPFFTTKSDGRGLGLAVVQRIVTGLGGTIQVGSQLGRGCTFRVFLPCSSDMLVPPRPASANRTPGKLGETVTVLLVEDEESLRRATAKMLRAKGFRVIEIADGTEAIAAINTHKNSISVVVLDITLPGRPSHEVLAEARRVRSNIKVIATSAYGWSKVNETLQGMEVDSFLRKPYKLADLLTLVITIVSTNNESRFTPIDLAAYQRLMDSRDGREEGCWSHGASDEQRHTG
jgi:PAS domain S-box-containing protein